MTNTRDKVDGDVPPVHSGLSLIVAFAVVVASFVAATVTSEYRASSIDAAALAIADDASPSIQDLAAGRAELRQLQLLLTSDVKPVPGATSPSWHEIERSRLVVDRELHGYLALPEARTDHAFAREFRRQLDLLDEEMDRLLALRESEPLERTRERVVRDVLPVAERTARLALRGLELEAQRSQQLALRIRRSRTRALRTLAILEGLSALVSILAGALIWRAGRDNARLVGDHQRLLAERAAELEQFASRVAHDILSPLSTIYIAIDSALGELPDESRGKRLLTRARVGVRRTKEVVDGLYEFARAGAHPPPDARAEASRVVAELVEELAPAAQEVGAEIAVAPFAPVEVACTPGVLTSLLSNLARNAIKYIAGSPLRRIRIRAFRRDGAVRFEVEDTGPGLPPELIRSVFEPYVRAPGVSQPGLGLGLATVKRLAETHGGTVGAVSMPGRGSLFWFELPRARVPEEPGLPPGDRSPPA